MKILHVLGAFLPPEERKYGLAQYELANALAEEGIEIHVILRGRHPSRQLINRINIWRIPRPFNLELFRIVRKVGPDLVNLDSTSGYAWALLAKSMGLFRKTLVVSLPHPTLGALKRCDRIPLSECSSDAIIEWASMLSSIARQQVLLSQADAIVVPSAFIKRDVERLCGQDPGKVNVVHYGIDSQLFRPLENKTRQRIRMKLEFAQNDLLLYVGHIGPRKGLLYLLEAFALLTRTRKMNLLIIGGLPKYLSLNAYANLFWKRARSLNIEANIHVMPYIRYRELPEFYNIADVFVQPSLYEGFGMAVAEAMACETPVVCTNVGFIPEISIDNRACVIVKEKDADGLVQSIVNLLEKPVEARDLGKNAREIIVRRFSWKKSAKELCKVYDKLID